MTDGTFENTRFGPEFVASPSIAQGAAPVEVA